MARPGALGSTDDGNRARVRAHDAILDGELVCLDVDGRSNFYKLLRRGNLRRQRHVIVSEQPATIDFHGRALEDLVAKGHSGCRRRRVRR